MYFIFHSIESALKKHSIPWTSCFGFAVDNTSIYVDIHNSIKTRALSKNPYIYFMGYPYHMAHNSAKHESNAFCCCLPSFDIEDLLADVLFWFDYSSKHKNAYAELCQFVGLEYRRIIKFMKSLETEFAIYQSLQIAELCTSLDCRVSSRVSSHLLFQGPSPESSRESSVSNPRLRESLPKFLESCLESL